MKKGLSFLIAVVILTALVSLGSAAEKWEAQPPLTGEMLAAEIASEHNLAFYLDLVAKAREHIAAGDFASWKEQTVRKLDERL